jgi:hypothetical protein
MSSSNSDDDEGPHRRGRLNHPDPSFSSPRIDHGLPPRPTGNSAVLDNGNTPIRTPHRPAPTEFTMEGFTFHYDVPPQFHTVISDFLTERGSHHQKDDTLKDVVEKNVQLFFQQAKYYSHFRDCRFFLDEFVEDVKWRQDSFGPSFVKKQKRDAARHLFLRYVAARVSYLDNHLSRSVVPSTASEREKAIISLVDDFRLYQGRTYTYTRNRAAFIQMTRTT